MPLSSLASQILVIALLHFEEYLTLEHPTTMDSHDPKRLWQAL